MLAAVVLCPNSDKGVVASGPKARGERVKLDKVLIVWSECSPYCMEVIVRVFNE